MTSSPTATFLTALPTASTTPARSLPCPEGNVAGHCLAKAPSRIAASPGLMPAAFIPMRTCCGPGTGGRPRRRVGRLFRHMCQTSPHEALALSLSQLQPSLDHMTQRLPSRLDAGGASAVRLSATLELGWRASRPTPEGLAEGDLGTDRGPLEMPPRQKCKRPGRRIPGLVFCVDR